MSANSGGLAISEKVTIAYGKLRLSRFPMGLVNKLASLVNGHL